MDGIEVNREERFVISRGAKVNKNTRWQFQSCSLWFDITDWFMSSPILHSIDENMKHPPTPLDLWNSPLKRTLPNHSAAPENIWKQISNVLFQHKCFSFFFFFAIGGTGGGSGYPKNTCIGVPDKRMRRVQGRAANAYTLWILVLSAETKQARNPEHKWIVCIKWHHKVMNLICQRLIIFQPVGLITYQKITAARSFKFWRMHAERLIRYDKYLKTNRTQHIFWADIILTCAYISIKYSIYKENYE